MSRHTAAIAWRSDGGFADNSYSRRHVWRFDGGAEVAASSSPDVVPVPMSDPAGVDPEEALVAAAASCHMLWFLSLAREAGLAVESYEDEAVAEMGRAAPGRIAITRITLRPRIAFAGARPDEARLDRLHHAAHERCFIANTLTCEIVVEAPPRLSEAPGSTDGPRRQAAAPSSWLPVPSAPPPSGGTGHVPFIFRAARWRGVTAWTRAADTVNFSRGRPARRLLRFCRGERSGVENL